jgi:hypothetical protein
MKLTTVVTIAGLLTPSILLGLIGPANAQVWSLEKTPVKLRPKLCADVRAAIKYDQGSSSYKYAIKRKQEGTLWRKHKERLAHSATLLDTYRRLDCRNY